MSITHEPFALAEPTEALSRYLPHEIVLDRDECTPPAPLNELIRQAIARVQRKIEQTKEQLKDTEVVHSALGDKIKVTATLGRRVIRIEIDPEFLKSEGAELALDGACVAINGALEAADKQMEEELAKITGGVKIPGVV